MDILSLLRTLGSLAVVLGMLAGALWAVKKYDIKLPGRITGGGARRRRIELVEKLSIDAKRSVALIRRDGCEHLILLGPEGSATIETGIRDSFEAMVADAAPVAAPPAPAQVEAPEAEAPAASPKPAPVVYLAASDGAAIQQRRETARAALAQARKALA